MPDYDPSGAGPHQAALERLGLRLIREHRKPKPWVAPKAQIVFYGESYPDASRTESFSVLAGDTAPTITGGWAKWNIIDRPQRPGLTIFAGNDPHTMQIAIRFLVMDESGWRTDDDAGESIQRDRHILEWMTGAGPAPGPSPIVYVSTYDSRGDTIPLIPFDWQDADTSNVSKRFRNHYLLAWIIQDLQWDQSPVINRNGFRIRQDATVTLQRFSDLVAPPRSAAERNRTSHAKPRIFHATEAANTPMKIAGALHAQDRVATANQIKAEPGNKHLHLRSITSKIRKGTAVRVPAIY